MNIGIVTIAYDGYGKFLPQWCKFIAAMNKRPAAVTAVLGPGHGLTDEAEAKCLKLLPDLKIVRAENETPTMGILRNIAVKSTLTEWIMYLSVDDAILPHAIDEYEKYEKNADYICIRWLTRGLGEPEEEHISPLPKDMAKRDGKGFIVAHSPFRRKFWEMNPYEDHNYPNQPFVAHVVKNGGRFVQTSRPCTVYLRRPDSHARTVLRGRGADPEERRQAIFHKARMEKMIIKYVANAMSPDVVYILGPNSGEAPELRYSLRSLKNVPHRNVFIVGALPAWAKGVKHISTVQHATNYKNAFSNLLAACRDNRISDDFIFMNDDFFLMKPVDSIPTLHRGPVNNHRSTHSGEYLAQILKTGKALEKKGFADVLSYELHVPMLFNKQKLLTTLRLAQSLDIPNKRTFYGNYWQIGGEELRDVKISDNTAPTGNETFLSTNDASFKRHPVGRHVRGQFPEPCEYESFDVAAVPIVVSKESNYRGTSMKIQDHANGEIHKTNSGNYVFVVGNEKSKEFSSVAALVHELEMEAQRLADHTDNEVESVPENSVSNSSDADTDEETSTDEDDDPAQIGDAPTGDEAGEVTVSTEETSNEGDSQDDVQTDASDVEQVMATETETPTEGEVSTGDTQETPSQPADMPSAEWSKKKLEDHYADLNPEDNRVFRTKAEVLEAIAQVEEK